MSHRTGSRIDRLGVGTVQFGVDYGVSNTEGRTPPDEVFRILDQAMRAGIRVLDTAASYGDSERVLGRVLFPGHPFRVITKCEAINRKRITRRDAFTLTTTFQRSLEHLNTNSVYGLLVHHADDLLAEEGELLFEAMQNLKSQRLVEKIGVSVYTEKQVDLILRSYSIDTYL